MWQGEKKKGRRERKKGLVEERRGEGRKREKKKEKNPNEVGENIYSKCLCYHFVSGLETITEELHLISLKLNKMI